MKLIWFSIVIVALAAGPLGAQENSIIVGVSKEASAAIEKATTQETGLAWLRDLLLMRIGDNSFAQFLACFLILLTTFFLRRFIVQFVFRRLKALAQRTSWKFDERLVPVLESPIGVFTLIVGIFFAITVLTLDTTLNLLLLRLFQASTLVVVFWGFLRAIDVLADSMQELARERELGIYHFIPLIKKAARVLFIVIGAILVIQNLGYSVGSLLAGLGIGGLAVALAAQESLGNFFGSITIAADRPFKVGDWIQIGDKVDGDVEEIGLRSTKVRTWSKSLMTIPNKVIANEIVENWSQMPKRRVRQVVGVTYETSPEDMDGLVQDIRRLLREDSGVQQDFILVNFTDFGSSSLDILVYYFTTTTKWLEHMDVRQRINLKIMKAVRARGLSIAFPTRTLYFEGDLARQLAGARPSESLVSAERPLLGNTSDSVTLGK